MERYVKMMRAALGAAMMMMLAARADAADLNIQCDVNATLTADAASQATICYVTQLQVGTTALAADLFAYDRTSATSKTAAAAFIESYSWNTAVTGPMSFTFYVSAANGQKVKALLAKPLTTATINFTAKAYDQLAKKYFVQTAPAAALSGAIPASGLAVGAAESVGGMMLSKVSLNLAPPKAPATAQNVTVATSATTKVVKAWGPAP